MFSWNSLLTLRVISGCAEHISGKGGTEHDRWITLFVAAACRKGTVEEFHKDRDATFPKASFLDVVNVNAGKQNPAGYQWILKEF
jgi:hypothetical protein